MDSLELSTRNPYVERIRSHPFVADNLEDWIRSHRNAKSIVDLGCGNGHFLEEYLRMRPELSGVGIERRYKRVFKTAEKIERIESSSARVFQMNIKDFFDNSPSCFWDEVWLQFPDPWPKTRHEKNRVVNLNHFQEIFRVLKNGGRFCFRSDCRPYWEQLQCLNIQTRLFPVTLTQKGDLFSELPTTLFQRKFLQKSCPIYSLDFRK